jgi:hypothetical protein
MSVEHGTDKALDKARGRSTPSTQAVTPPDLTALATTVNGVVTRMQAYDVTLTAMDIQAALNAFQQMQVLQTIAA